MTISDQPKSVEYIAAGDVTDFTIPWTVTADDQLVVLVNNVVQFLGADYTIPNVGAALTTVRFGVAPVGTVFVYLDAPMTQATVFSPGPIRTVSLQTAFDEAAVRDRSLEYAIEHTLRVPATEDGGTTLTLPEISGRSGKVLGFDALGLPEMVDVDAGAAQHNFAASREPTITDDMLAGYELGSLWAWAAVSRVWICLNAQTSAAQWQELTGNIGGTDTFTEAWYGTDQLVFGTDILGFGTPPIAGFSTLIVAGQSSLVAPAAGSSLIIEAGTNVTLTTDPVQLKLTVDAAGGGVGATTLDDLTDVVVTTPTSGQWLTYNGTRWVNATPPGGGNMSTSTYDQAGVAEQLVGRTATQTLTNKTIDDATNTVRANKLRESGGAVLTMGNVSDGQHLVRSGTTVTGVSLPAGVVNLDDLGDVVVTSPQVGQLVKWDGAHWVNASVAGGSGAVLQVWSAVDVGYRTLTATCPVDDTIPQIAETAEYTQLALTLTPSRADSIIELCFDGYANSTAQSVSPQLVCAVFVDAATTASFATLDFLWVNQPHRIVFRTAFPAASTLARTYHFRFGTNTGATTNFNGRTGRLFGGVMSSAVYAQEVLRS